MLKWTEEQCRAWAVWRDQRMVDRVGPNGDAATVDRLLGDQREIRRNAVLYDHPSSVAKRQAQDEFPTIIGSVEHLQAHIRAGRIMRLADNTFDTEEVRRALPAPVSLSSSTNNAEPSRSVVAELTSPPLLGRALQAALDKWANDEWGPGFEKLPGWEEILRLAKNEFPDSPVIRQHARNLRRKYATSEAKKGGAPTHR